MYETEALIGNALSLDVLFSIFNQSSVIESLLLLNNVDVLYVQNNQLLSTHCSHFRRLLCTVDFKKRRVSHANIQRMS